MLFRSSRYRRADARVIFALAATSLIRIFGVARSNARTTFNPRESDSENQADPVGTRDSQTSIDSVSSAGDDPLIAQKCDNRTREDTLP